MVGVRVIDITSRVAGRSGALAAGWGRSVMLRLETPGKADSPSPGLTARLSRRERMEVRKTAKKDLETALPPKGELECTYTALFS